MIAVVVTLLLAELASSNVYALAFGLQSRGAQQKIGLPQVALEDDVAEMQF